MELTIAEKIPKIHQWYCLAMGREGQPAKVQLDMHYERLWYDWLQAGYTPKELRTVMRYLKQQISSGKRNHGSLALQNLLEAGVFSKDLLLATADLDPEKKLPPSLKWERATDGTDEHRKERKHD